MSNHNNIWLANWGKNAHLGIYKGLIFRECGLWGFVDKGDNLDLLRGRFLSGYTPATLKQ